MTSKMLTAAFFLQLGFPLCHPALAQHENSVLPNPKLTPGHAADVTAADICKPEYTNPANNVPFALRGRVYARYAMNGYEIGYNVDHLIPIRLGGSNSLKNLWPQPLSGEWNWLKKNKLERTLRKLVCSGRLDLKLAQQEIATDWIGAYKKYVGEPQQVQPDQPR